MGRPGCVCVGILALMIPPAGWADGPDDPDRAAGARLEYLGRKARLAPTARSHWELGLWCEEAGLEEEARGHFAEVVRLDPSRGPAWERLGYSKVGDRWLSEGQVAAAEAQERANEAWGPRLSSLHDRLRDDRARQETLRELAEIDDPAAVPSIWNVFTRHGADDQMVAVQLLGQVTSPESSALLATLAVHGRGASVRRAANESLRLREPDDYAPTLIALMRPLSSFEYRLASGPGDRGLLVVSCRGDTLRRVYTAPGVPTRVRPQFSSFLGGVFRREFPDQAADPLRAFASKDTRSRLGESYRANLREAFRAAEAANRQLAADVAGLEAMNAVLVESNDRIAQILRNASGQDLPPEPEAWQRWLDSQAGRTHRPRSGREVTQFLPLAYVPQYVTDPPFR